MAHPERPRLTTKRKIARNKRYGRVPVTVCIAAICQEFDQEGNLLGTAVLGASDRRVTYGDIEYDPPTTKVLWVSKSIALMSSANDSALQSEIFREVQMDVHKRIEKEPENWWKVKDVAELYAHHRNIAKAKRAEMEILSPIGLTRETLIENRANLGDEFMALTRQMQNFQLPYLGTIVAGVDNEGGAHIYVVESGENRSPDVSISCYDGLGFASIGSGAWHANSQFMLARHAWHLPFPQTLGLIYLAKKRAEIAPGVGSETDMFKIGSALGTSINIGEHVLKKLHSMHKRVSTKEKRIQDDLKKEINQYVDKTIKEQTQKEQSSEPPQKEEVKKNGEIKA